MTAIEAVAENKALLYIHKQQNEIKSMYKNDSVAKTQGAVKKTDIRNKLQVFKKG